MELIFAEDLFPVQFPVDERTQHWILMFAVFGSTDIKALERILSQQQRCNGNRKALSAATVETLKCRSLLLFNLKPSTARSA